MVELGNANFRASHDVCKGLWDGCAQQIARVRLATLPSRRRFRARLEQCNGTLAACVGPAAADFHQRLDTAATTGAAEYGEQFLQKLSQQLVIFCVLGILVFRYLAVSGLAELLCWLLLVAAEVLPRLNSVTSLSSIGGEAASPTFWSTPAGAAFLEAYEVVVFNEYADADNWVSPTAIAARSPRTPRAQAQSSGPTSSPAALARRPRPPPSPAALARRPLPPSSTQTACPTPQHPPARAGARRRHPRHVCSGRAQVLAMPLQVLRLGQQAAPTPRALVERLLPPTAQAHPASTRLRRHDLRRRRRRRAWLGVGRRGRERAVARAERAAQGVTHAAPAPGLTAFDSLRRPTSERRAAKRRPSCRAQEADCERRRALCLCMAAVSAAGCCGSPSSPSRATNSTS